MKKEFISPFVAHFIQISNLYVVFSWIPLQNWIMAIKSPAQMSSTIFQIKNNHQRGHRSYRRLSYLCTQILCLVP